MSMDEKFGVLMRWRMCVRNSQEGCILCPPRWEKDVLTYMYEYSVVGSAHALERGLYGETVLHIYSN